MKNILVLASGDTAAEFIDWINRKRVADNHYDIVHQYDDIKIEKAGGNLSFIKADPTSYGRLKHLMSETKYANVFVVMDTLEEVKYVLKNLKILDKKVRIVLLNLWSSQEVGAVEENVTVLHAHEILTAHLYDQLPNVPVIAQNVGLGRGEIMEIHVPFGSSYAYRHVGSILQRKWKIAAIYREEKQIMPTSATMIRPNDVLLVLGKPIVLDGVYKSINKRAGLFPEPFGKDLYLILDLQEERDKILLYLKESIYLMQQLEEKTLYVRLVNPGDFELVGEIKAYESDKIEISVYYDNHDLSSIIEYDLNVYDVGLVLSSIQTFENNGVPSLLYRLKKLVYLFGNKLLYNIKECMVVMSTDEMMESISSTAFEISEALHLKLTLGDFDPEGDFESKKMIVEHYETLMHIFNMEINVEQKIVNPIRELSHREEILQIAPFEKHLSKKSIFSLFSTRFEDFLLTRGKHPKLLVPFAL